MTVNGGTPRPGNAALKQRSPYGAWDEKMSIVIEVKGLCVLVFILGFCIGVIMDKAFRWAMS